ncbi:MAG: thiosulfate oxidation carrier complex protein SoxZ [Geminicoccaceae bacterium]
MDEPPRIRVKLLDGVGKGGIVEVRTMISHPMENGRRREADGALVPRRIINRFTCTLDGEPVIDVELHTSIAASPYIAFDLRAERPGRLELRWYDDDGGIYATDVPLKIA